MPEPRLVLTTGDPLFSSLFQYNKSLDDGFKIPIESGRSVGTSILVHGKAGTGKTTFACQLCVHSMLRNKRFAEDNDLSSDLWPSNASAVYFTLDQRASEVADLMRRIAPKHAQSSIQACPVSMESLLKEEPAVMETVRQSLQRNLVTVFQLPYDTDFMGIRSCLVILDSVGKDCESNVRLLIVDSVNLSLQMKFFQDDRAKAEIEDGSKIGDPTTRRAYRSEDFRYLIGHAPNDSDGSVPRSFSSVFVYEAGDDYAFPEEFLVQGIVALGCDGNALGSRTIQIRKARHQRHHAGNHDLTISHTGLFVSPSIPMWAQTLQSERERSPEAATTVDSSPLTIGVPPVDNAIQANTVSKFYTGSTTLVFGKAGTGKSDLLAKFFVEQWRQDPVSSVLFGTWKRDPRNVLRDLIDEASKDPQLKNQLSVGYNNLSSAILARLVTVDMRDPYFTIPTAMTKVVRSIDQWTDTPNIPPVKRSGFFGLKNLNESPAARDEQWNFLRVLTRFLESREVSTLLIDWPMGDEENSSARPLAARLCANEIFCDYDPANEEYQLIVKRANFQRLTHNVKIHKSDLEVH
ncbi:hypothetical protein [Roseimaritima sediminicola]|uniref:hypothetical protein n=1 Tax=Roseimaritima sediminicola TaxID=2662066 RepID=UPI0012984373|nr:hypothetical protein [Roseimaritima sediminicola]